MTPALDDVVIRSAVGVLSTENGGATDKAGFDAGRINAADFVVPTIAVGPAFRRC